MIRFWSKVDRRGPDDCWPWLAEAKGVTGQGRFYVGGRMRPAHVVAYEEVRGPIPAGNKLYPLCSEASCVNPAHWEPGPAIERKKHKLYSTWSQMIGRCANDPRYVRKGITVCDRWRSDHPRGFENFLADMGERPPGLTIDRRDNSKGYCPENCRWATYAEQAANRDFCHRVPINGKVMSAREAERLLGMKRALIRNRLNRGVPMERALDPRRISLTEVRKMKARDAEGGK